MSTADRGRFKGVALKLREHNLKFIIKNELSINISGYEPNIARPLQHHPATTPSDVMTPNDFVNEEFRDRKLCAVALNRQIIKLNNA